MSWSEWRHIQALRAIEPVGHEREAWQAAISTSCQLGIWTKEPVDPIELYHLMMSYEGEQAKKVSPNQAVAMMRSNSGNLR